MAERFTLQDCIDLATFAHRHQLDQAGEPYINHPLRVLASVQAQGARAYVQMAAVLHDVTEDTPFTSDILLDLGVPPAAVEVVRLVDRDHSKAKFIDKVLGGVADKEDIDAFYYAEIRRNSAALQVKLADIGDNLQPWRLEYLSPKRQQYLRNKYDKALTELNRIDYYEPR